MNKRKTTISKAGTIEEIAQFWDSHDLADHGDRTNAVTMEFEPGGSETYYRVESGISERIREHARKRGVSPETLLNLWAEEKLRESAVG